MYRIAVVFLTLALSVAFGKSYTINIIQPTVVSGVELKPGVYKLDLEDGKIILRKGSLVVEAEVKAETLESNVPATKYRLEVVDGKYRLKQIDLRGTNTRLVLQ